MSKQEPLTPSVRVYEAFLLSHTYQGAQPADGQLHFLCVTSWAQQLAFTRLAYIACSLAHLGCSYFNASSCCTYPAIKDASYRWTEVFEKHAYKTRTEGVVGWCKPAGRNPDTELSKVHAVYKYNLKGKHIKLLKKHHMVPYEIDCKLPYRCYNKKNVHTNHISEEKGTLYSYLTYFDYNLES